MLDLAPLPWASHPTSPDWAGNTAALAPFEWGWRRNHKHSPALYIGSDFTHLPPLSTPFFERGRGMDQDENCNRSIEGGLKPPKARRVRSSGFVSLPLMVQSWPQRFARPTRTGL
jgi:hypothetical protein